MDSARGNNHHEGPRFPTWANMILANYYVRYSLVFTAVAIVSFLPLFLNGKTLIDTVDGIEQHYTWFVFEGRWLREIYSNLISGASPIVPQWTFSLGYGADIITSMSNWIGDPLNTLSAFCPIENSAYFYTFLWIIRPWLAGITFSFYGRKKGWQDWSTLMASIVYCFSGFSLVCFIHPNFYNPLILFPLILAGADNLFEGRSPILLISALFLSFSSWFYFSYMILLLLLVYCLVQYFGMSGRSKSIRDFAVLFCKFVGCIALGATMAATLLMPIVSEQLSASRLSVEHDVPLLYLEDSGLPIYYLNFLIAFFSNGDILLESPIGYGAIGLLCTLALFFNRTPERRHLRIWFIVLTAFALIPVCGWILNGFSYVSNRWVFGYCFCVCCIIAELAPELHRIVLAKPKHFLIVTTILLVVVLLQFIVNRLLPCLQIAVLLLIFALLTAQDRIGVRFAKYALIAIVCAAQAYSIGFYWSQTGLNHSSEKEALKQVYNLETNYPAAQALSSIDQNGVYRYDRQALARLDNNSLFLDVLSIDFYDNMYNNNVATFNKELEIASANSKMSFHYTDLDARSALETIAGVRWFAIPSNREDLLPCGHSNEAITSSSGVSIYELPSSPQLAFTYKSTIDESSWEELNPVEKQETLLEGCIVESDELAVIHPQHSSQSIPFGVSESNGASYNDGYIEVTKPNSSITLNFESAKDSETYLRITNLDYKYLDSEITEKMGGRYNSSSRYEKNALLINDLAKSRWFGDGYWANAEFALSFSSSAIHNKTQTSFLSRRSNSTTGETQWLINCGYSEDPQTEITISFPKTGLYNMNLEIYCQPMDDFEKKAYALQEDPVKNLTLGTNTISGNVTCSDNRLLYFAVPWAEGWSAALDGQPVEIERANIAFMAIEAPEGEHEFELVYSNPKTKLGLKISIAGWIVFVAVICIRRYRMSRHKIRADN